MDLTECAALTQAIANGVPGAKQKLFNGVTNGLPVREHTTLIIDLISILDIRDRVAAAALVSSIIMSYVPGDASTED